MLGLNYWFVDEKKLRLLAPSLNVNVDTNKTLEKSTIIRSREFKLLNTEGIASYRQDNNETLELKLF